MHRFTRKEYADKLLHYTAQVTARVYVHVYAYVYVRVHVHTRATCALKAYNKTRVSSAFCCLVALSAWWVCADAQVNKDAPRWSTADVYDRDLR